MIRIETKRCVDYSPLRYPGGKSSLTDFFAKIIDANFEEKPRYVEPFAGGAGAAIALLLRGRVSEIIVNDLDPAMWSLWESMVHDAERFQKLVRETPVTLDEWRKQKQIYAAGLDGADSLDLGFATFFLNRTNRSGVLNAGVIGGQAQAGTYRIDARYNKATLLHRLGRISAVRDRIDVRNMDGRALIGEVSQNRSTLVYADPPYYDKGSYLYLNSFTDTQHAELAEALNAPSSAKWILTYDDVPAIRDLYSDRRSQTFSLHYSAHKPGVARELMVFSDNLAL
ncbi:DNA methyltransferase [Microbacterium sp. CH12i]|uniref:DNA adenine methylase n=1 Tax=Microbacterium sp. CH12i TaxID=1479651 RepID=UPI000461F32C|nr:DNA adenine methylase [Microbacterium sp. CH12i]KDA04514.1 DNA methyltransferase [Microbacterium sp. CH12i]